jgi:hypothetical protein
MGFGSSMPTPGVAANPFTNYSGFGAAPFAGYRNAANPDLGAATQTPTFRPHVLDDPTLRALGLPQPVIKPAEPPPKKINHPSQLQLELPKRQF